MNFIQFSCSFFKKQFSITSRNYIKKVSIKFFLPLNQMKMKVLVTQLCLTLCDLMNYSPLGSSAHGSLQERILEWVAMPFSRGPSQPRDQTWASNIVGRFFIILATREAVMYLNNLAKTIQKLFFLSLMQKTRARGGSSRWWYRVFLKSPNPTDTLNLQLCVEQYSFQLLVELVE